MRRRTSLKDIASEAGFSTAVVSFVLNNKYKGRISEEKAARIREIARELNYFPNQIAKSLKSDKTNTIGLIIADISNLFYSNVARYIEDKSKKHNYNVIFASADENADKFHEIVQVMLSRQVDGIILAAPFGTEQTLSYLHEQKVPFVLIDRIFPELTEINSIIIDNYHASYSVIEHLAKNGYKKPAMVTLKTRLHHMKQRTAGFEEATTKLLSISKPVVIQIKEEMLSTEVEKQILQLLEKGNDCIYFTTNKIAMEGLAVLAKHHIAVPDQVGVVCFDEADAYKIFQTSITYVKQPLKQIAYESVEVLLSLVGGNQFSKSIVMSTQLITHDSTRKKARKSAKNLNALPAKTSKTLLNEQ